jgi:hypothetical protein
MARKTPQQKKRESYAKDRRNTYGERGARSRFGIARARRARASRARAAGRHAAEIALRDPELAERLEGRAVVKFGGGWHKIADTPLGDVVARKLKRRERVGGVPDAVVRKKVQRIRHLTNR